MNEQILFFDTYAFFCVINGNPAYKKFEDIYAITTIFNLAELNFALKREKRDLADKITNDYSKFLVSTTVEDITEAMSFRIKNRKLSIPDAIGYTVAKRYQVRFLTGDKEFEKMPNVEFVK